MLLIPCPFCGEREESEFHQGGEAHIVRPKDPDELSDAEWADYLFLRKNTKGLFLERWVHLHGCRRWFNMARNTATNEIIAVYKMGAQPPKAAINKPPKTAVDKPPKAVGKGAKK
ncbi:MAG: sarcosine oxidase subunit delta [Rhodospirillaceae bacterium]|jgi:heterotetrameric sarcosine oxidase delta subunit|nr:sarcosine oxidase subunit delta [Rhodospirillaceae bacterium]MBT5515563.1 sarcosine oxidase subunit delta [Rhodospirillaceae bacterium]MBT6607226.1 sarcosine oxidase subunit delta [Rhodospirillaceae bacterium]MBT6883644.1 sarcosine oxidase subunit delta [Rhodospirillaceae bacterium]